MISNILPLSIQGVNNDIIIIVQSNTWQKKNAFFKSDQIFFSALNAFVSAIGGQIRKLDNTNIYEY